MADAPIPLFMWADDSTYGGQNAYVLDPVLDAQLPALMLPEEAASPELLVAYIVDHLSADEVADEVRSGHLSTLQATLQSSVSSAIAPYTYRDGLGALAAALAQLTNRTVPGGQLHALGAVTEAQAKMLSSHASGWRPVASAELTEHPMFTNGVVDVLAVFCGATANAEAAIEATEASLAGRTHVSILTAVAAHANEQPTRVVHMGGGARRLLESRRTQEVAATPTPTPDYVYGSANFLSGLIFSLFFVMIVLLAVNCMSYIQTPTQYWAEEAMSLGKVDD